MLAPLCSDYRVTTPSPSMYMYKTPFWICPISTFIQELLLYFFLPGYRHLNLTHALGAGWWKSLHFSLGLFPKLTNILEAWLQSTDMYMWFQCACMCVYSLYMLHSDFKPPSSFKTGQRAPTFFNAQHANNIITKYPIFQLNALLKTNADVSTAMLQSSSEHTRYTLYYVRIYYTIIV